MFTETDSDMCLKCKTQRPKPTYQPHPELSPEEEKKQEEKRNDKVAEERKLAANAAPTATATEEEMSQATPIQTNSARERRPPVTLSSGAVYTGEWLDDKRDG